MFKIKKGLIKLIFLVLRFLTYQRKELVHNDTTNNPTMRYTKEIRLGSGENYLRII